MEVLAREHLTRHRHRSLQQTQVSNARIATIPPDRQIVQTQDIPCLQKSDAGHSASFR
jgi:hypothetical protein